MHEAPFLAAPAPHLRPLAAADLPDYKSLRDQALADHPEAFTSDADTERRREPADYLARLGIGRREGGHFTLGAFAPAPGGSADGGALLGAVSLERDPRKKVRHIGHVIGMIVRSDRRRRGIGAALLDATLAAARDGTGLARLTLSVTEGNEAAERLYASRGFVVYGRLDDAIRVGGRRLAKVLMTRAL